MDAKQHNASAAHGHVAAKIFKRCYVDVEITFLEHHVASVDNRQTSMILEVDSINACTRQSWVARRRRSGNQVAKHASTRPTTTVHAKSR